MTLRLPSRRDLRFASGIVLFAYLSGHLINHALGLVSLEAAEVGLDYATTFWQSPAGTFLLYGGALTHMGLALHAVYERRTLRMPFRDLFRIVLGLNLPVLLIAHAASTRLAMEVYGYNPFYNDVVRDLWLSGSQGKQFAILAPGWIHGCLGLHAAFGRRKWWRAAMPVLFGIFLVLPILSALGFVEMHREIERFNPPRHNESGLPRETAAAIALWRDRAVNIYLALVGVVLLARIGRWLVEHRSGAVVEIAFPGRSVRAPRGWTVLEASRANHIAHLSACGGRARCSTCRVRVAEGLEHCPAPLADEAATLARISAADDIRLACQLRPHGSVSVIPLLGTGGAGAATIAHEEVFAVLFVDLVGQEALAGALLPQDLQWLLTGLYRAVDQAVRAAGGTLIHAGQEHASALFPAERDRARGCAPALAAVRALETAVQDLGRGLDDHWKTELRVAICAHVGPVLVDATQLTAPGARFVVAVGPAIAAVDRLRDLLKTRNGGVAVTDDLLAGADEAAEGWGEPVAAAGIAARFRPFGAQALV